MNAGSNERALETTGEVRATRPRTTKLLWWGAAASFVAACPATLMVSSVLQQWNITGSPATILVLLTMFSPLIVVALATASATAKRIAQGAHIETDRTLVIHDDAQTRIPADQLVSGATASDGNEVQVQSKSGVEYRIGVTRGASASWLETLGLGAAHKLFHARMHRIFYQLLFWMLGAPTIIGGAVSLGGSLADSIISEHLWSAYGMFGGLIVGVLFSLWMSLHYMGSQVTIGTDGIKVRDGVFSRFIAWSDVASTAIQQPSVTSHPYLVIDTREGKRHSIWLGGDTGTEPSTLLARIDEARAVAAASKSEVPPQLLARGGRSVRDWAAALVNLLDADAGYRSQNLDPTALLRLVRDATAPIEQRIAAALALSKKESTREQVRVVAAATANEQVRVALESATKGELDERAVEQAIASDRVRVDSGA